MRAGDDAWRGGGRRTAALAMLPVQPVAKGLAVAGLASTSASELLEALDAACRIVASHHEVLKAPSEEALAKQLGEFYDSL